MIPIKSFREIDLIRKSGEIVAYVLLKLEGYIKEGVTTNELEQIAEELIKKKGGRPAFKGYQGFPSSICTSINEEIIHGIPSKRRIRKGDIISIDVGVKIKGFYSDAAKTFVIEPVDKEVKKLVQVTEAAFFKALEQAMVGNKIGNISFAIQNFVESFNFSVVRDFTGHGIGASLHEEPKIPNFGKINEGPFLKEGMVLAIEPMVTMGSNELEIEADNWTVKTKDKSLAAHFEHTIVITKRGPEILTLPI